MKVLITSGGTTEPIDNVRGINNFATGALGKMTAECFLNAGHQVILLLGDKALHPNQNDDLTIIPIKGTQQLYDQMKRLVPDVDVVVHTMAVSDYRPVYMTGFDNLPEALTKKKLIEFRPGREKKISSQSEYQIMLLEKTPKIISFIKDWNPHVILFGFKLLAGVSETELLRVATDKIISNRADFIIANDLEKISKTKHEALLISADSSVSPFRMTTKQEIAEKILSTAEIALKST